MNKNYNIKIIVKLLLIISNGILCYYFFQNENNITFFVFCLLLIFQLFLFIEFQNKQFQRIENAMDSLLHDDFSAIISTNKSKSSLYNKTAKLLAKQKQLNLQKTSEELIFTNILESLSIGILILRKKTDKIEIYQINKAFADFLKIPKYYKWNLLNDKISNLTKLIDPQNWQSFKKVIELNINNEEESFFLKTSVTKTYDYEYLIISLETIQQLIDKKEKESWYKLMNVMSHEIINTITPISSLAGNLGSLLEDNLDTETQKELKQGLDIIKKRSHHLTDFVNSYRKLAELPSPNLTKVSLSALITNTLLLFEQQFKNAMITVNFNYDETIQIQADKQQLEQVLINVFSNCYYAVESVENPTINIELVAKNKRTTIHITDNGIGIPDKIKNQIFVPYFTTRKEGSGIGLALSKSIMEANQGTIHYASINGKTCFILSFME